MHRREPYQSTFGRLASPLLHCQSSCFSIFCYLPLQEQRPHGVCLIQGCFFPGRDRLTCSFPKVPQWCWILLNIFADPQRSLGVNVASGRIHVPELVVCSSCVHWFHFLMLNVVFYLASVWFMTNRCAF